MNNVKTGKKGFESVGNTIADRTRYLKSTNASPNQPVAPRPIDNFDRSRVKAENLAAFQVNPNVDVRKGGRFSVKEVPYKRPLHAYVEDGRFVKSSPVGRPPDAALLNFIEKKILPNEIFWNSKSVKLHAAGAKNAVAQAPAKPKQPEPAPVATKSQIAPRRETTTPKPKPAVAAQRPLARPNYPTGKPANAAPSIRLNPTQRKV